MRHWISLLCFALFPTLTVFSSSDHIHSIHFGSQRDGDAGFLVDNTTSAVGEWTLSAHSLNFSNRKITEQAITEKFTEATATIDLSTHRQRVENPFTISLLLKTKGLSDWTRLGIVAFSSDMRGREYDSRGFIHAQIGINGNKRWNLAIQDGFSNQRPLVQLPLPGKAEDGTYRLSLSGWLEQGEQQVLRLELVHTESGKQWLIEEVSPTPLPTDTFFGFGGKFRTSGNTEVDLLQFTYSEKAAPTTAPGKDLLHTTGIWNFQNTQIPYTVTLLKEFHRYRPIPTVVYLKNLPIERIGTDEDQVIINDLLNDGLVVIELDASGLSTEFPDLQQALASFDKDLTERILEISQGAITTNPNLLYWLPEGYRLERNVPFWNIQKHGVAGTMESLLEIWNANVVKWADADPATTVEQMHTPSGSPIDYNLYMDIIYPSGSPTTSVPTVAHFSTVLNRPGGYRGSRAIYPISWLTSGYALAYIDYAYTPHSRLYYGHRGPYSLGDTNGIAIASAAIRFLRAHAQEYNLGDRIGALGHSKSSYMVARLADKKHSEQNEWRRYRNTATAVTPEQPWPGYSSQIQVAYVSMGHGTWRTQLYNTNMAPVFTAAGIKDQYGEWERFPALVSTLEEKDLQHHALWMGDIGHTYPEGIDFASGQSRSTMVKNFFDQQLHPHGKSPSLQVLAIIPAMGNSSVSTSGESHFIIANDTKLPKDMHGLPPSTPITVIFCRPIKLETVTPQTLQVRSTQTGENVSGQWRPSLQNTRFRFDPDSPLSPDTEYEIMISTEVSDVTGYYPEKPTTSRFRTLPKDF